MFTHVVKVPSKSVRSDEKTYIISLPQADGTTHSISVSPAELTNLGINHLESPPSQNQTVVSQNKEDSRVMETIDTTTTNIIYKIIKPEDLDLKPTNAKYLPRGRPRKKVCVEKVTNVDNESKKVIKQARTRSGRITKPPKHIEIDFKKIDITDDTDLKTTEFEPLKTNDSLVKEEPLLILEQHCKKRNIPSRYRCPTCNKAYLGKAKMLSHFEKHPDHGSVPENVKCKNTATWDFLILTAQKFKGSKVIKFCEELEALLENAKKMAKYLFKPLHDNEQGYFINNQLANVFGIKAGSYTLDDAELFKDVSLYDYLESNITAKCEEQSESVSQKESVEMPINIPETTEKVNEIDLLTNHLNNQNSLALVKYEIPKLFNFSNPSFSTNNESTANFHQQGINMPSSKEEDKHLDAKKEIFHHLQKEITLQNELHDVDELMLENVDTGQVNILETSSNSDDIMNVDQFVNERFKKLTEPDIDIQANSLNLELPPLDIFQFHTS